MKEVKTSDLMRENQELKDRIRQLEAALHDRANTAHDAYTRLGAYGHATTHRGAFDNCPCPRCVETRFLLDKGKS
jgi:hypothetical protein